MNERGKLGACVRACEYLYPLCACVRACVCVCGLERDRWGNQSALSDVVRIFSVRRKYVYYKLMKREVVI